jgi:hypothetical protein
MKKNVALLIALFATATAYGQDKKWTVNAEADLVSSYIWNGMYQAGTSFQPELSLSAYGLTLGAWGSTDLSAIAKELDFSLSYEKRGFSASITDYWWSGEGESFFKERGSHFMEAGLGYKFQQKYPLALGVNTMFWGDGDKKTNGNRQYSTFISASYPFTLKGIGYEAGICISPWRGMYSDNFNVAAITARATKSLQLTENYALPVFVELILSPAQDNAYLVFGLKF